MKLDDLMETTPETLAERQHSQLKKHVVRKLETVLRIVQNEDYEQIKEHTDNSPAGDGYGTDHDYIDFDYRKGPHNDGYDIVEITEKLAYLRKISKELTGGK